MRSRRDGRTLRSRIARRGRRVTAALTLLLVAGCGRPADERLELDVPHGYAPTLEVRSNGRILSFGPFVGYYFRPEEPSNLTRLRFVCFNERSFYTLDLPANAKLFEGEAVLVDLPEADFPIPRGERIEPVFFGEAPAAWLDTRPEPQAEFVHFHSCHDGTGAVLTGYWLRHVGVSEFTYDMGGRVDEGSPLHHRVRPGPDKDFARIVEFDRGP